MTTYVQYPATDIQLAIAEAHQAGATTAQITMFPHHAAMEDNRNGDDQPLHKTSFNTRLHPSRYRYEVNSAIESHIAPVGITVTVQQSNLLQYPPHQLRNLHDIVHNRAHTPDLGCEVYITTSEKLPAITIIAADGTSTNHSFQNYHGMGGLHYANTNNPGELVQNLHLSVIAVTEPGHQPPKPADLLAPALRLTRQLLFQRLDISSRTQPPGLCWPSQHLINLCDTLLDEPPAEHNKPWPDTPSTSQYRLHPHQRMEYRLTPTNAAVADFDSVQISMLVRAIENSSQDIILVHTNDTNVTSIRLLHADVTLLNGETIKYPARIWNRYRQSGRYDGAPMPQGNHLPHSRVERVRNIAITLELQRFDSEQPYQTLTIDTDAYMDQDNQHHLLLITEQSDASLADLRNIAYLYPPDVSQLDQELVDAMGEDPRDWGENYLNDMLYAGTDAALRNMLRKAALAVEANITAHHIEHDAISVVTASGAVSISLERRRQEPAG